LYVHTKRFEPAWSSLTKNFWKNSASDEIRLAARAELRAISRETALRILHTLTAYAHDGTGDVKAITGKWQGHFRLRVADYRIVFTIGATEITIVRIRHRSEVYR